MFVFVKIKNCARMIIRCSVDISLEIYLWQRIAKMIPFFRGSKFYEYLHHVTRSRHLCYICTIIFFCVASNARRLEANKNKLELSEGAFI